MSRLKIATPNKAQLTVERLYKDLERRIIASPPGLCPVDLQLSFLKMCHAQTCGKCVPCRVGLGQLQNLMEDVLAGKATLKTLDLPTLWTPLTVPSVTRRPIWYWPDWKASVRIMSITLNMGENVPAILPSRFPVWRCVPQVWISPVT